MKKTQPRKRVKTAPRKTASKKSQMPWQIPAFEPSSPDSADWPSREWLAEMTLRLLTRYRSSGKPQLSDFASACEDVLEAWKTAKRYLWFSKNFSDLKEWHEQEKLRLEQKELSKDEIAADRVSFDRGCKLITCEDRRLRAIKKWREAVPQLYAMHIHAGAPVPDHEKEGFSIRDVAEFRIQFAGTIAGERKS